MSTKSLGTVATLLLWPALATTSANAQQATKEDPTKPVNLIHVPGGGIQPQVALDAKGTVHLIYYRGAPEAGDIFYVHSENGGTTFSEPLQVNSTPGSAIAMGNIRGAHLALGKVSRAHVAWLGSSQAQPKAPQGATPMIYTRMNDKGTSFEPERNVIQSAIGLDGGGSVAADPAGNVYVAWHAPGPGLRGEDNRQVWVAKSTDDGKTFATELAAFDKQTGACGCCGMRAFAADNGSLYLLYRSATERTHRDMYLLGSTDRAATFQGEDISAWNIDACPMSTAFMTQHASGVLAAWETKGQVYFAGLSQETGKLSPPIAAPGDSGGRKYPTVASNSRGETILVWTEGVGWNRGGSLAWQIYGKDGQPIGTIGRQDGVPTWSLVAVYARPDGRFTIVY